MDTFDAMVRTIKMGSFSRLSFVWGLGYFPISHTYAAFRHCITT